MSLWSDYEAEAQFAKDFPHGVPCDEWVTRDGSKIKLRNMTVQHIRNCMRVVGEDDPWYGTFVQELRRRGKNV